MANARAEKAEPRATIEGRPSSSVIEKLKAKGLSIEGSTKDCLARLLDAEREKKAAAKAKAPGGYLSRLPLESDSEYILRSNLKSRGLDCTGSHQVLYHRLMSAMKEDSGADSGKHISPVAAAAAELFDLMKARGLHPANISETRSLWARLEEKSLATADSLHQLRADVEEKWGRLEDLSTLCGPGCGGAESDARLLIELKKMVQLVMVEARRRGREEVEELHDHAKNKAIALAQKRGDDVASVVTRLGKRSVFDVTGRFHHHPLSLVHHTPERWMCDGCELAFDGDVARYRCRKGCDYDMCRDCFTLAFMWVCEENENDHNSDTATSLRTTHRDDDPGVLPAWVQHRMRKPTPGQKGPPPGCWTMWHGISKVPVSL